MRKSTMRSTAKQKPAPKSSKARGGGESGSANGAAISAALRHIKKIWGWSGEDFKQVLHIPASTINSWISNDSLNAKSPYTPDVQAVLTLIAINRSLEAMFEKPELQLKWLETVHPDFDQTPLSYMSRTMENLIGTRQYLDYARGRGA